MRSVIAGVALMMAMVSGGVQAQEVSSAPAVGMIDNPCPVMPPKPQPVIDLEEAMIRPGPVNLPAIMALTQKPDYQAYAAAKTAREAADWAGLCVYREDNAALAAGGVRPDVVMMGDSITENWARADEALFAEKRIVGRGVGGQASAQMLVRFRADVIALRPRVVHILAGTNDVAGNGGLTSPDAYRNTIMSMVDLARANGIQVVLGALLPAERFFWRPGLKPADQIVALNDWLRTYAAEQGVAFVDYHAALTNERGGLPGALSVDGTHPNRDAYAIMDRLLLAAVN